MKTYLAYLVQIYVIIFPKLYEAKIITIFYSLTIVAILLLVHNYKLNKI